MWIPLILPFFDIYESGGFLVHRAIWLGARISQLGLPLEFGTKCTIGCGARWTIHTDLYIRRDVII